MTSAREAAPLAVLERLRRDAPPATAARRAPAAGQAPAACELCNQPIAAEHPHLVDLHARSLLCACRACHLLFSAGGAGGGHFKGVPDRYLRLAGPDSVDQLDIPVGVAFFFYNSSLGRVAALYPGPAGATESELAPDGWDSVLAAGGPDATPEPDVEAVVVRSGAPGRRRECYLVPIDCCYELVGRLRMLWRGFDGGQEARDALDAWFEGIGERAR